MSEELVRINTSIRKDQYKMLKKHPEINLSGFLRKQIDRELMEKSEG